MPSTGSWCFFNRITIQVIGAISVVLLELMPAWMDCSHWFVLLMDGSFYSTIIRRAIICGKPELDQMVQNYAKIGYFVLHVATVIFESLPFCT